MKKILVIIVTIILISSASFAIIRYDTAPGMTHNHGQGFYTGTVESCWVESGPNGITSYDVRCSSSDNFCINIGDGFIEVGEITAPSGGNTVHFNGSSN